MPKADFTYTLMLGDECAVQTDFVLAYDVDFSDSEPSIDFHDVLLGDKSMLDGGERIHMHIGHDVIAQAEADEELCARLIEAELSSDFTFTTRPSAYERRV